MLGKLDAELARIYPEDGANFLLLPAADVAPGRGTFLVATADDDVVGCGGMRVVDPTTAEIKRMYVEPGRRRQGIGEALLVALEQEAVRLGARRTVLETGTREARTIAFYERSGYRTIPNFGDYAGAELSRCMAKEVSAAGVP
jgi:GNAT superfamily N-acetyltransferase